LKIEIVTTPNEKLKETGFGSSYACHCVLQSLLNANHQAVVTVCVDAADLTAVINRKPDLIIGVVKYILLENGQHLWLSEYFENEDINYTGSNRQALSYDSNKVSAKQKVASKNIDTAKFFTAIPNEYLDEQSLPLEFPLFVKPIDAANGNGVDVSSLVHNFEDFQHKVQHLYDEYAEPALVEEYLNGREFTAAVIEDGKKLIIAAIEVISPEEDGIRILGAKVKAENTETLHAIKDKVVLANVMDIAKYSFRALDARDFARIDIKMDQYGTCYFMEANLVPGMKKGSSYFPQACEISADLSYDEVVLLMLQGAVQRVVLPHIPETRVISTT
jgi:D-alanine-D-alanine ligase